MYDNGKGVPKDHKTAVKWYRLAAEQGNAYAQYNLGTLYDEGEGVVQFRNNSGVYWIQDNIYAHMWYSIAASSGHKSADKYLQRVAKKLTPSQLEKAKKLARECVRKKYKGC